jgi:hypothetical protein
MTGLAALVYLGAMSLYFAAWKEDVFFGEPLTWLTFVGLALLQVAVGATIGSWWAVALPFGAILVAVPFGYGEGVGQEAPIAFYYGYVMSVPAALLTALGVGLRRLVARRR